ncbi:YHYH protein [Ekhidna sp.]
MNKNTQLRLLIVFATMIFLPGCGEDSKEDVMDEFSATVTVSASQSSVTEAAGTASFTIAISEQNTSGTAINIPFSITGTATANSDYEINETTAIIANNESSATVQVTITDDTEMEENETIILSLGSLPSIISSGSTTEAMIIISDNDAPVSVEEVVVTVDNTTSNSVSVGQWADNGADSYIVVINTENSFTNLSNQSSLLPSTSYLGFGQQVVYNNASIASFELSLLSSNSTYYLKVVPVSAGSYDNDQEATSVTTSETCETSSTTESQVCFDIGSDTRTISSNQYPSHAVGNFPNGTPTAIEVTRELDLTPQYTNQAIYIYNETGPPTPMNDNFWQFGMAVNGVEFHPMGLKAWTVPDGNSNAGEENWEWQAKVTEEGETDLDAFGAHVTSQGNYHYHGDIVGLADEEDGTTHSLIYGFAADGFPIYYKYGYSDANDPTSSIVELETSYQLKSGARTGTGTAGVDYPDGNHDGSYIQDYEYVAALSDLDECNGRTGVTPEYPNGTYYYVITSKFPVVPNCFYGTPADDWKIGK